MDSAGNLSLQFVLDHTAIPAKNSSTSSTITPRSQFLQQRRIINNIIRRSNKLLLKQLKENRAKEVEDRLRRRKAARSKAKEPVEVTALPSSSVDRSSVHTTAEVVKITTNFLITDTLCDDEDSDVPDIAETAMDTDYGHCDKLFPSVSQSNTSQLCLMTDWLEPLPPKNNSQDKNDILYRIEPNVPCERPQSAQRLLHTLLPVSTMPATDSSQYEPHASCSSFKTTEAIEYDALVRANQLPIKWDLRDVHRQSPFPPPTNLDRKYLLTSDLAHTPKTPVPNSRTPLRSRVIDPKMKHENDLELISNIAPETSLLTNPQVSAPRLEPTGIPSRSLSLERYTSSSVIFLPKADTCSDSITSEMVDDISTTSVLEPLSPVHNYNE
jgi:hypothetical protein